MHRTWVATPALALIAMPIRARETEVFFPLTESERRALPVRRR